MVPPCPARMAGTHDANTRPFLRRGTFPHPQPAGLRCWLSRAAHQPWPENKNANTLLPCVGFSDAVSRCAFSEFGRRNQPPLQVYHNCREWSETGNSDRQIKGPGHVTDYVVSLGHVKLPGPNTSEKKCRDAALVCSACFWRHAYSPRAVLPLPPALVLAGTWPSPSPGLVDVALAAPSVQSLWLLFMALPCRPRSARRCPSVPASFSPACPRRAQRRALPQRHPLNQGCRVFRHPPRLFDPASCCCCRQIPN